MHWMTAVGMVMLIVGIVAWSLVFRSPKFPLIVADFERWSRAKFPRLSAWFPPCDCIDLCHCAQSEPRGSK